MVTLWCVSPRRPRRRREHQGALQHTVASATVGEARVASQQGFHLGAKGGVVRAGGLEERRTLVERQRDRLVEELLDAVGGSFVHPPSSRASHARAKRHSRATVLDEIPRIAAVSSTLNPAK